MIITRHVHQRLLILQRLNFLLGERLLICRDPIAFCCFLIQAFIRDMIGLHVMLDIIFNDFIFFAGSLPFLKKLIA